MRKMKDSGVEWIGEIPEDWSTSRLGYVCDEFIVPMRDKPQVFDGNIPWCRIEDIEGKYLNGTKSEQYVSQKTIDEMNLKVYPIGTVINSCSATIGVSAITTCPLCTNQTFIGLVAGEKISNVYLYYMMNALSEYMKFTGHGSTITYISQDKYKKIGIPLPSIYAQKCIAEYLDSKCTRIDEIIDKQRAIIEKLKEYKLSIITEAVTKGLNPDVEMKDSGVEWIGQMPTSWDCTTVGRIATVVRGASPRPAGDPLYFNGNDVPWITVAEVTKGDGKYIDGTETFLTFEGAKQSRIVEEGTLLLSNSGATLGVPKITRIRGCINDGSVAFYNLSINQEFLLYLFKGRTFELRKQVQGYGQPNLNTTIVKGIEVPLPTELEQKAIVDFLDQKCTAIEKTIEDREKAIEKLQEYKKSLIYEVVTGKKEV